MDKVPYTVRIDPKILESLRKISALEHRSLNGQMESFLQMGVDWFTDADGTISRPYDLGYDRSDFEDREG